MNCRGVSGLIYIERIDRVFTGERWGDTSRKAATGRMQGGELSVYIFIQRIIFTRL